MPIFKCSSCNREFMSKQILQYHIDHNVCTKNYNKRIIHKCPYCNKVFSRKANLQCHIDRNICEHKLMNFTSNTIQISSTVNISQICHIQHLSDEHNHIEIKLKTHTSTHKSVNHHQTGQFTDKSKLAIIKHCAKCSLCSCDVNYGEYAHIVARGDKGPRNKRELVNMGIISDDYDVTDSNNGLYVCPNCHTKIDHSPEIYTFDYLMKIKKNLTHATETHLDTEPQSQSQSEIESPPTSEQSNTETPSTLPLTPPTHTLSHAYICSHSETQPNIENEPKPNCKQPEITGKVINDANTIIKSCHTICIADIDRSLLNHDIGILDDANDILKSEHIIPTQNIRDLLHS